MAGYQLKIKLQETTIWRQVVVPKGITLHQLHQTIQVCMGWKNCHSYTFNPDKTQLLFVASEQECEEYQAIQMSRATFLKQRGRPMSATQLKEYRVAQTTAIDELLVSGARLVYRYDMGDNWEHEVSVEAIDESYSLSYPTLLDGEGSCPPEQCGGVLGYMSLCSVLSDASHEEYASYREWFGDYELTHEIEVEDINNIMKQWGS